MLWLGNSEQLNWQHLAWQQFYFIAMSVGIGFSTAITPLVAEGDSAKGSTEVKSIFYHGLLWCLVLGLALFLLVYLSRNLMFSMGQPEEVVELAFPLLKVGSCFSISIDFFSGI
ncbi:MAG: hypothetical protein CM15mP32_4080 [Flavobacteriaceae bacterium]|nr:MAG: hypothetical protein CM15mP32_4080 [Flavobacteriaceae bacterium]